MCVVCVCVFGAGGLCRQRNSCIIWTVSVSLWLFFKPWGEVFIRRWISGLSYCRLLGFMYVFYQLLLFFSLLIFVYLLLNSTWHVSIPMLFFSVYSFCKSTACTCPIFCCFSLFLEPLCFFFTSFLSRIFNVMPLHPCCEPPSIQRLKTHTFLDVIQGAALSRARSHIRFSSPSVYFSLI